MIAVDEHYGDEPTVQHIEACRTCGALVFVAAHYAGGSHLDTRTRHAQWHAQQAMVLIDATQVAP